MKWGRTQHFLSHSGPNFGYLRLSLTHSMACMAQVPCVSALRKHKLKHKRTCVDLVISSILRPKRPHRDVAFLRVIPSSISLCDIGVEFKRHRKPLCQCAHTVFVEFFVLEKLQNWDKSLGLCVYGLIEFLQVGGCCVHEPPKHLVFLRVFEDKYWNKDSIMEFYDDKKYLFWSSSSISSSKTSQFSQSPLHGDIGASFTGIVTYYRKTETTILPICLCVYGTSISPTDMIYWSM